MQPTEPVIPPKPAQLCRNAHRTQPQPLDPACSSSLCPPASPARALAFNIPVATNDLLHHKATGLASSDWKQSGERATYWALQLHYPLFGILFRKWCPALTYVSSMGTKTSAWQITLSPGLSSQHGIDGSPNRSFYSAMSSNFLTRNLSLLGLEIICVALEVSDSVSYPFTKTEVYKFPLCILYVPKKLYN